MVNAPNLKAVKFLNVVEYREALLFDDVFISHAGIGIFIDMRKFAKPCLIIPRSSRLDEYVDDHQRELAKLIKVKYNGHVLLPGERLPDYSQIAVRSVPKGSDSADAFTSYLQAWIDS